MTISLNDKSHTYFHSASGNFICIDLTLSSPSPFLDFTWKVGFDPCGSDHFPIIDICKDTIKEYNMTLERFKHESTKGNLNTYRIAGAKACRDVQHSKKRYWRNYVSKMNYQTFVKSVWNRISKIKGNESSNTIHVSVIDIMIEMSYITMTLVMHWR